MMPVFCVTMYLFTF